ncbi:MAG: TIR domain-containing protein [Desertifilum sp. SIO1I2]|nr:TIR domain-containing protein [Desertifilum sp. SIO1I2]
MSQFQDAFISYGRADSKAFAQKLNARLVEQGLEVWFDFDDIPLGVDYQKQIDDGIEKSDNFLFVIAPHSINSPYCRLEVELALKRNKRIIPLLHVEQISRDTWQQRFPQGTDGEWEAYTAQGKHSSFTNMHPEIAKINWVYFRENVDDFEQAFQGLLALLERHKAYVHRHTYFLARALEWERNQKRSPYLLVGEERDSAQQWLNLRFQEEQPPCIPTDLHCEFITESIKNARNLMSDVFLAYAEEDIAIMEKIRNLLRRQGLTVWTNKSDIQTGTDFQEAIARGIEGADNLVYLMSPSAVESAYCQTELDYALSLNKRIVPLLVQPLDASQIPPALKDIQYIDLTDNPAAEDYQRHESNLIRTLRHDAADREAHKVLLTKALKWKRQQENPSILLRGYNLRHAEAWLKTAQQRTHYLPLPVQVEFITESLRQPPGIALDVFVSYSRTDSDFARRLNDALQIQGKTTWFDQESIASGSDFQQEIYRGIENSDHFLFIISPNSIQSPYCADEVEYAKSLNKRIVTILHRPVNPADLHPVLASVQWIDFNQYDGDFSANFKELIRTLDTDLVHLHAHTRLLVRAIEWDNKERKESLLLRGDDLEEAEQWLVQSATKNPKPTSLQQDYINSSRSVEEATQQAARILQEAVAKGQRRIQIGTAVMAIALVAAGLAGLSARRAIHQTKQAQSGIEVATAKEEILTGQPFDALLIALQAGQNLKPYIQSKDPQWDELKVRATNALQLALSEVREKNSLKHKNTPTFFYFTPNGQTLISGCIDRTLYVWNAENGQLIRSFNQVQAFDVSADGQILVLVSSDNEIQLWRTDTGELLDTLKGAQGTIRNVQFSPDARSLVSINFDNVLQLWNLTDGQSIKTLGTVQDFTFSSNSQTIAATTSDRAIQLWNATTGKPLSTLKGSQAQVSLLKFSPDDRAIATVSDNRTMQLWDLNTGRPLYTFQKTPDRVTRLQFSPNGQTIALHGEDKILQLVNRASGQRMKTFEAIQFFDFSTTNPILALRSQNKKLQLWNIAQGKVTQSFEEIQFFNFSPDGRRLVTVDEQQSIHIRDLKANKQLGVLKGHEDDVIDIKFSPDGQTIASASWDNTIKVWQLPDRTSPIVRIYQDDAKLTSFSPDGQRMAFIHSDNIITIRDMTTNREIHRIPGNYEEARYLEFSPDGKLLFFVSGKNPTHSQIKLWNLESGQEIRNLPGDREKIYWMEFSPDNRRVALFSTPEDTSIIKLWDLETGKEIRRFDRLNYWASFNFSADGQMLALVNSENTVSVRETATDREILSIPGTQGSIKDVAFSPDGQILALAGVDETLSLWNIQQNKAIASFEEASIFQFSPNGQKLAFVKDRKLIHLWDAATAQEQILPGHRTNITSLIFSPDSQEIASTSWDDTFKLWNIATGQEIRTFKGHRIDVL